ncbi:N-acetyltransferase [Hyphomicrobium sp. LHD-15]|uniref:GNAT family N-acetyltransferase n=1 Tax=Hyphomicrobium sp. LHD-15 TaxID=3072142 RepID=UPI00280CDE7C|nr:N-acetyltransferase [Hyphomicrobium sp. LHD-15]MDQ8700349.1 N-acetyltransferase [Hyphomicrobium sp. LHD-15]
MLIRPETPDLVGAIRALHLAAFPTSAEADLVDRLRRDGDATLSLVALDAGTIAGHLMLSPMHAPMKALGLGPLAVRADRRRQGIGGQLIRNGLAEAKAAGWEAIFVLGEPAFYGRFGFDVGRAVGFETPYAGPYFMILALDGSELSARSGRVDYAPAFADLE